LAVFGGGVIMEERVAVWRALGGACEAIGTRLR